MLKRKRDGIAIYRIFFRYSPICFTFIYRLGRNDL